MIERRKTMSDDVAAPSPYAITAEEGTPFWFVGALMVRLADAHRTGGVLDLLDQTVPPGYAPPRHVHAHDDEAWYVLEGDATFWCGDRELRAGCGSFVFLPKGVEHTFRTGTRGARLLTFSFPSGFADFVAAAGEPAPERTIPRTAPPDPRRLAEIAARYGIEITGPPPH
jgi:mannose-6-phosphate isomerase-like protein (cupin superfamily)